MLQETHSNPKHQRIWHNEWGSDIIFDHGLTNARGVCIFFKPKTKFIIKSHNNYCGTGRML